MVSAQMPTQPQTQSGAPLDVDVLVVGGGINGAGIARDLAGRGWRVMLVEKDDLAAHTSSSSTKLIHGGLRYLEHKAFGLVRKALQEREVLLRSAPHIMRPLRFVMPHDAAMRPAWLIRLGLFFYDHLARREILPASRGIKLRGHPLGVPLQERFTQGFVYSDGWVDDARLVVLNAMDAQERGAEILTGTRCVRAVRGMDAWTVELERGLPGQEQHRTVRAKALVNAAGPWARQFLDEVAQAPKGQALSTHRLRLVKGSHIVVPRVFAHEHAYIFQAPDGRIIFAIPYEGRFTLIGTTDVEVPSMPDKATIGQDEVHYLCEQASRYFKQPVQPADVLWTYAGVRPLLEDAAADASAVTRDYVLETSSEGAPLMTVWGGKITTYRKLAEQAADQIADMLPAGAQGRTAAWTEHAVLPGGDLSSWSLAPVKGSDLGLTAFVGRAQARYPWLPVPTLRRWSQAYGTRMEAIIGQANSPADLGLTGVPGLFMAELRYLVEHEWARNLDDVLWRRSKLGLHLTAEQQSQIEACLNTLLPDPAPESVSQSLVQGDHLEGELVAGVQVDHGPRQLV
jgi:glycerol-3-phosphate dehydrogenase